MTAADRFAAVTGFVERSRLLKAFLKYLDLESIQIVAAAALQTVTSDNHVQSLPKMTRPFHNDEFSDPAFLNGVNAAWLEAQYARFKANPKTVDAQWRAFFANLHDAADAVADPRPSWERADWPVPANGELVSALDGNWMPRQALEKRIETKLRAKAQSSGVEISQAQIYHHRRQTVGALRLIRAFRERGHLIADLDPLGLIERRAHPDLQIESYGFTPDDMDTVIFLDGALGLMTATLKEIIAILHHTYSGKVGFEFMHIADPKQRAWIEERIEGYGKEIAFTPEGKRAILNKLIEAESFERFLDMKYTGTKRFGLEGGEAVIPALEQIIKRGGQLGLKGIVMGMAHRGRLNVLANVMNKPLRVIFHEFHGGSAMPKDVQGSGDVKYHLGASADRSFDGNKVHLSLSANPSHLEAVDPVVLGKARAKQDQHCRQDRSAILPLLLHGDAAFAGQGVVAECFGLSGLQGHRTGGSIHFIINNQIGFTTTPKYARSSPYPSAVAKMVQAPIFHVNGDDPEAVVHCARIATEFRQKFMKPVVIDMFCYRRFGHNEGDEPAFTQPVMYRAIKKHPTVVELYARKLLKEQVITPEQLTVMKENFRRKLDSEYRLAASYEPQKADWLEGKWSMMKVAKTGARRGRTAVSLLRLKRLGEQITTIPEGFDAHHVIKRVFAKRRKAVMEGRGIDWATAEALAFASLVDEGINVRLSGQDVERGTFSQRHAVLVDQQTERKYTPIDQVGRTDETGRRARFEAINSMLSEYAVLGFEYGYSVVDPRALVLWEAQFGDFANGAQVIIDQFIASGERKWLRMSGLVMLLPHGYEGQGPEHSSARLERYLQLCAEDNWQVANCTTPANYFHILRRQVHRDFRKPLVLMTPKSLLRHKRVVSSLEQMGPGSSFHRILRDDAEQDPQTSQIRLKPREAIKRVVMCSGKVYYDLLEAREARGIDDVYLLRIEQLYPFPESALKDELRDFTAADMVWCQEEPKNMGAWSYIEPKIEAVLKAIGAAVQRPRYIGRPESAATATGLLATHEREKESLIEAVFSL